MEAATFHFSDAMLSYRCALELLPDDPTITDAMKRTTSLFNKDKKGKGLFKKKVIKYKLP